MNKNIFIISISLVFAGLAFNGYGEITSSKTLENEPTVKEKRGLKPAIGGQIQRQQIEGRQNPLGHKLPAVKPSVKPSLPIINEHRFTLRNLVLVGNTVLSEKELSTVAQPYLGKTITLKELFSLRQQLSQQYKDKGYVNSGVVIENQQVQNGVVKFTVVESKLRDINVVGLNKLSNNYVRQKLTQNVSAPLRLDELRGAIAELQADPLIQRVSAQLLSGTQLGASDLLLEIEETAPIQAQLSVDNYRSPEVGGERVNLAVKHINFLGLRDQFSAQFSGSEGINSLNLSYSLPILSTDIRIGTFFSISDSSTETAVGSLDNIDIEGESSSFKTQLDLPLWSTDNSSLFAYLAGGLKESELVAGVDGVDLELDLFGQGIESNKIRIVTAEAGLGFTLRGRLNAIGAQLSVKQGLDALDATINEDPNVNESQPDGEFTLFVGQFQVAQKIPLIHSQFSLKAATQLTLDALLPTERFAVGGRYSVRGYRENLLVRDNAAIVSLEWKIPCTYNLWNQPFLQNIHCIAFADAGTAWNEDVEYGTGETAFTLEGERDTLTSVGLGFNWLPVSEFEIDFYYGHGLEDKQVGDDLQDDGLHFSMSYNLRF